MPTRNNAISTLFRALRRPSESVVDDRYGSGSCNITIIVPSFVRITPLGSGPAGHGLENLWIRLYEPKRDGKKDE